MLLTPDVLEALRIEPGKPAGLVDRQTDWRDGPFAHMTDKQAKARAKEQLEQDRRELSTEQELLWASDSRSLLVIFQAIDAAGKDGTIEHVMSGVNPQGCQVTAFKQPSAQELDHDFLWRAAVALPERGRIGIFNRSYYEEVLVVRVHPEWLVRQKLPDTVRGEKLWRMRYESINDFERHLDRSGTTIVKFFLHLSKEEQRQRFLARLEDPEKEWKFSADDVREREHWDDYMDAFDAAISATSTEHAPWYVIPADRKWLMRTLVAGVLVNTIRSLQLTYPTVNEEQRAANQAAKAKLESEGAHP